MIRNITIVVAAALLLAACSGGSQRAFNLNGIWGGVMTSAGTDFAVFAMDVTTTSSGATGTVSGYGIARGAGGDVYLNVTGSTGRASIALTLTDVYGDVIRLNGSVDGSRINGTWTYPAGGQGGSYRMAHEDNIHLLSLSTNDATGGAVQDLFPPE